MQTYSISIDAPKDRVWNMMMNKEHYIDWAKAFSEEATFDGEFHQGAYINFIDPGMGGTKAHIEIFKPYDHFLARHIALISKEGVEDTDSEMAKKWIGCTEAYTLTEEGDNTKLLVEIESHEEFHQMFNDSWPKALNLLKSLCES